ncbi:hypothetical protein [Thauera sp.]|uniref:hypothetical protein n=1 Tax=Thauera sp. TaxID=1905334 RepID=UPI0039E5F0A5
MTEPCRKCWWKSITLWVNALAAALVALEAVTGKLQPHLSVNLYTAMSIALPVINAVLRVITTQGLKL